MYLICTGIVLAVSGMAVRSRKTEVLAMNIYSYNVDFGREESASGNLQPGVGAVLITGECLVVNDHR